MYSNLFAARKQIFQLFPNKILCLRSPLVFFAIIIIKQLNLDQLYNNYDKWLQLVAYKINILDNFLGKFVVRLLLGVHCLRHGTEMFLYMYLLSDLQYLSGNEFHNCCGNFSASSVATLA